MLLLQPTTALFRGGAAWDDDPFWIEGWEPDPDCNGGIGWNRHGYEVGYSLPSRFDFGKLPERDHPSQDLAESLLVTVQSIDRLFRTAMNPVISGLDDYLASWHDVPTLAPKETALARLESAILAPDYRDKTICALEAELERDSIRRTETFRRWQQDGNKQAEAAWDHRLTQLNERNGS